MNSRFTQRGGFWVVCQVVLLVTVIGLGLYCRGSFTGVGFAVLGVILMVLGGICGVAAAPVLGPQLTPFPRPVPGGRVVQHGIYGLIRHPLYTAVFLAAVGGALVCRSAPSLVAALALGPFFLAKARREERWLREHHPEYADYERRVRRFIPWLY